MEKYKTRQRDIVISCLEKNSERALTVDNIVDILKGLGSPVGRTTVYRCLDYLVNCGEVRKFVPEDKSGCTFQLVRGHGECAEHFHLRCSECGALIHLSCDSMKEAGEHILEHHGFLVDKSKTVLYGLCRDCLEKRGGENQ